jgi:hypothetical protein
MYVWPPLQSISTGFDVLQSFYILGAVTLAWAFVIDFFLPDSCVQSIFPRNTITGLGTLADAPAAHPSRTAGRGQPEKDQEQAVQARAGHCREFVFPFSFIIGRGTDALNLTVKDIKIWILPSSVFVAVIPNGVVRYVHYASSPASRTE